MDIQVDGARMVRVLSQDAFGDPHGVANLPLRGLAICLPVIPGREVHDGVDREDRNLRIVRKAPRGVSHRLRVGAVEGGPFDLWVICVAFDQGLDQGLFPRTGPWCQCFGFGDRGHGGISCSFVHGCVDIGTQHKSLTPVAHGTALVLFLGLTEGAQGFRMVEGIREPQPLIKIALRQEVGRGHGISKIP